MTRNTQNLRKNSDDADATSASPFDPVPAEDGDLWFLPAPPHDPAGSGLAPLPRSDRRLLFDPEEWRRAQGELSGELAALTLRFGVLEERLRAMGEGARQRLAICEAAEMAWWTGRRIGVERLTLWVGQHAGAGINDSQALALAGWAVRHLAAGLAPAIPGWAEGIAALLGRPAATPIPSQVAEVAEVLATLQTLHPVTQAAVLFHAWRLAADGPARDIEAAVLAACHGARMGQGPAPFLPLATAGVTALHASGSAQARLAGWLRGAEQATLSALMQLDRLRTWRQTAEAKLAGLTGRTPKLLLDHISAWPMISVPMAVAQTGASRAAVQRNLEQMEMRGLIREITGQGRYRVWVAKL